MESEVCFEQTNMRGQTVKQRNREGQTRKATNKGGGTDKQTNKGEERVASDGFGENLFISCLKIDPTLRNFQVT